MGFDHNGRVMDSRRIVVTTGAVEVTAELNDTPTADAVWEALPFDAAASTWGDEIYFAIPASAEEEPGASPVVEMGAVAYWPPGSALCLFFGPTPASRGNEIRAASAVNVLGSIDGDPTVLKRVRDGERVTVGRA